MSGTRRYTGSALLGGQTTSLHAINLISDTGLVCDALSTVRLLILGSGSGHRRSQAIYR